MFQDDSKQSEKENYIVRMLMHTLYSNNVSNDETYRIVNKFYNEILGFTSDKISFTNTTEVYLKSISESLAILAKQE